MKTITLTKGTHAIVDDADYDELVKYKWYTKNGKNGTFYAQRDIWYPNTKRREKILMHRQIMQKYFTKEKNYTDHINHDGLDNRRCNLRVCTNSENMQNRKNRLYSGSIWWDKTREKWSAQLCINYKKITIGRFNNKNIAEQIMIAKAKSLLGEFAVPQATGGDINHG